MCNSVQVITMCTLSATMRIIVDSECCTHIRINSVQVIKQLQSINGQSNKSMIESEPSKQKITAAIPPGVASTIHMKCKQWQQFIVLYSLVKHFV